MARATITIETDIRESERILRSINPNDNPGFVRKSLVKGGLKIQREAATNQIKRGGKGPPEATRLTSRTGTGRRSIRTDRKGVPRFFIDIGSDLRYMQVHETGGIFSVPAHVRTSSLGNTYTVGTYSMNVPKRAYMKPALDAVDDELAGIFLKEWKAEFDKA